MLDNLREANRALRSSLVSKHFIDLKHAHMADKKRLKKRHVDLYVTTTYIAKCSNPFEFDCCENMVC